MRGKTKTMAKSNKQQLDELLGILDEVKASSPQSPSTPAPPKAETIIPDDLPESGSNLVAGTVNLTQPAPPAPPATSTPPAPVTATPIPPAVSVPPGEMDLMQKDDAEIVATQKNLEQIDDLIVVSKNVMQHVYGVVTSTDILDAATIAAAAKLISETRALIAEHLTIQKDERDFLNKVQMEAIKHRHQMELMEKKFELEQKRFQQKNPAMNAPANNVQPMTPTPAANGMKAYSSADLRKMLEDDNG